MTLEGRVCIVTGGAMGLGRADAAALARAGAHVVMTDKNEKAGRATAEELGERVTFVPHDVADEQQWIHVISDTLARFGNLDVLVNNAGVIAHTEIEETTQEQWRLVNAVSSDGTFFGCKHAIRAMRAHPSPHGKSGSIINMSSVCALRGFPTIVAYAAAKSAVLGLTKAVAAHCLQNKLNIRCNALLPGNMDTPMVRNFVGDAIAGATRIGSPEDVANAVLFLASDQACYLNGAEIVIDSGISIVGHI